MIEGFEKETSRLTEYERETLLPIMRKCLQRHVGKENAVTNAEMVERMEDCGYVISPVRVRKLINHIRTHALVECLIASGRGYYVTTSASEMRAYIASVKSREDAIMAMREALEEQLDALQDNDIQEGSDTFVS